MKHLLTCALFTFVAVMMQSCLDKQTASPVPLIAFNDFKANKDTANLFLDFTDGDGDIGLTQSDTVLLPTTKSKKELG
jgi:hypothetical protein